MDKRGNPAACVVLAASRDEGYWIRELVFLPLTARGIDLFLLESPYYGLRRDGRSPSEITVADHGLMALGMVLEARALLDHLKPQYRKLAVPVTAWEVTWPRSRRPFRLYLSRAQRWPRERQPVPSTRAVYCRGVWTSRLWGRRSGARAVAQAVRYRRHHELPPAGTSGRRGGVGLHKNGYVLPSETERLYRHWKGSELRWIEAGHFSALMTRRRALQECVEFAVERL